MPRHPQGDKAMTGAERQRRWRERMRQHRPAPETDGNAALMQALNEVAALREEVAALREQLAAARATSQNPDAASGTGTDAARAKLKAMMENLRLREELDFARKSESEQVAELHKHISRLQAEHNRRDAAAK